MLKTIVDDTSISVQKLTKNQIQAQLLRQEIPLLEVHSKPFRITQYIICYTMMRNSHAHLPLSICYSQLLNIVHENNSEF